MLKLHASPLHCSNSEKKKCSTYKKNKIINILQVKYLMHAMPPFVPPEIKSLICGYNTVKTYTISIELLSINIIQIV